MAGLTLGKDWRQWEFPCFTEWLVQFLPFALLAFVLCFLPRSTLDWIGFKITLCRSTSRELHRVIPRLLTWSWPGVFPHFTDDVLCQGGSDKGDISSSERNLGAMACILFFSARCLSWHSGTGLWVFWTRPILYSHYMPSCQSWLMATLTGFLSYVTCSRNGLLLQPPPAQWVPMSASYVRELRKGLK